MNGAEAKEKGNAAFKSGDYPGAIGHYTAAILADPKNTTYPLNRAAAYLKLGKNEDAERDCARVIELDAKNVKAWFRRGQARAGLGRLEDANKDFAKVLQFEPKNDAAQAELKKIAKRIKERKEQLKSLKKPVEVKVPLAAASHPPPKRRRVPITIIDNNAGPSSLPPSSPSSSKTTAKASSTSDNLMQAVSTRTLQASTAPATKADVAPSQAPASNSNGPSAARKASTFKEAKQAREAHLPRPGGGIFRSNGEHTLFDATRSQGSSSSAPAPEQKPKGREVPDRPQEPRTASSPTNHSAAKATMTLFDFNRTWARKKNSQERWEFMQEVSPSSLPAMFKTSLEPTTLVSLLQTFKDTLRLPDSDETVKAQVREYLIYLSRVPRFSTLVMLMSPDERRLVKEIWDLLLQDAQSATSDAADAQEKKAWGVS